MRNAYNPLFINNHGIFEDEKVVINSKIIKIIANIVILPPFDCLNGRMKLPNILPNIKPRQK